MSGIVGHVMYAVLTEKAAAKRGLSFVPVIRRHFASYLAGAYLGCDIQTLPEAICVDTGKEVGHGTTPLSKSPITGGKVKPWKLTVGAKSYTPREIHPLFYGRSHLVFGWSAAERRRGWGRSGSGAPRRLLLNSLFGVRFAAFAGGSRWSIPATQNDRWMALPVAALRDSRERSMSSRTTHFH